MKELINQLMNAAHSTETISSDGPRVVLLHDNHYEVMHVRVVGDVVVIQVGEESLAPDAETELMEMFERDTQNLGPIQALENLIERTDEEEPPQPPERDFPDEPYLVIS